MATRNTHASVSSLKHGAGTGQAPKPTAQAPKPAPTNGASLPSKPTDNEIKKMLGSYAEKFSPKGIAFLRLRAGGSKWNSILRAMMPHMATPGGLEKKIPGTLLSIHGEVWGKSKLTIYEAIIIALGRAPHQTRAGLWHEKNFGLKDQRQVESHMAIARIFDPNYSPDVSKESSAPATASTAAKAAKTKKMAEVHEAAQPVEEQPVSEEESAGLNALAETLPDEIAAEAAEVVEEPVQQEETSEKPEKVPETATDTDDNSKNAVA